MELRRQDIDTFAFAMALAVLSAPTLAFLHERNGAAVIMCGLVFTGFVAARLVGVSGLLLLPAAVGLAALLWFVWIDPVSTPRRTSAIAHTLGGGIAGLVIYLSLRRSDWPAPWFVALAAVVALTIAWELGEYVGDRLLDTALIPSKRDSALDIFFGSLGGFAGVCAGVLLPRR